MGIIGAASFLASRRGMVACSLLAGFVASRGTAQESLAAETFRSVLVEGATLPYRLFVPSVRHEQQRLPVVLFLHGAGERGTDNRAQLRHGVETFVSDAAQAKRPCVVVVPQCPRGVYWPADGKLDLCLELLDELNGRLPIDPRRVYVTGLSMGGYGTWYVLAQAPGRFAAAVPICGGGPVEEAAKFRHVPIWAFHGQADRVVAPDKSRMMIAKLRDLQATPKFTEYPGVGHNSWSRTYANPQVHEWLFAQRRPPRPLAKGDRIVFFGDSITEQGVRPGGYVDRVIATLRERLPERELEFVGAGVGGDRVPDLQKRLAEDVLAEQPDVVVIYIGINDVWRFSSPAGGTAKDDYRAGLFDLVARIRVAGDARIVLCTPSVIGEKIDGSNPLDGLLDEYASISRAVATDCGIGCVDLRATCLTYLCGHNEANVDRGLLTVDTVHLGSEGNRLVAEVIAAELVGGER